ncbi:MAG TPA: hemolysin family protein [Gemmatimonadota bacterium]|nr:hemolysin family protein [Gemmatimonadota bacterium]
MIVFWLGTVAAILAAGFFSLAEMALVSVGRLRLRHWVRETIRGGWIANDTLDHPYRLLSPILVGHALAVTAAGVLSAEALASGGREELWGAFRLAAWVCVAVLPPLYLFGEILPRAIARARGPRLFRAVSLILLACGWLFHPFTAAADRASRFVLGLLGIRVERGGAFSRRILETLLLESERVGIVEPAERKIIAGVFEFGRTPVEAVMTPRDRMVVAPAPAQAGDITKIIRRTGYSRVPLYRGTPDRIMGMVHVFDLFRLRADERPLPRPVVFTPPSTPCDDLLLEMKGRRCHLAIVVRAGRAVGMVTMEDLVEELVGEIRDEHDNRAAIEEDPTSIVVDGHRSITEINREHGLDLPSDQDRTVAEFVAARFGRVPRPGESLHSGRLTIEVIDSTPQRVRRIRLRRDH